MKSMKIKTKMAILMLLVVLSGISVAGMAIFKMQDQKEIVMETMELQIRADFDQKIKEQVDNAVSVLQRVYDDHLAGVYTKEEAEKIGANLLRNMRYGTDGYFWADKKDGTCVVLLGKDTEGTNRADAKDANGFPFASLLFRKLKIRHYRVADLRILPSQKQEKQMHHPKEDILFILNPLIGF